MRTAFGEGGTVARRKYEKFSRCTFVDARTREDCAGARRHMEVCKNTVCRRTPSVRYRTQLSDVYAVHAFFSNGAEVSYLETITCSRCAAAPATVSAVIRAEFPYCSTVCRSAHKEQHDAQCLTTLMSHMKVTVETHENFNVNSKQFEAEQKVLGTETKENW